MKNESSANYFYLLPFSEATKHNAIISTFFFLIYLVGVLINSSIITVICLEVQLHKPMYLFICNLSIVDIFYTSVTVPKLLHMLLSRNHIVSFSQCYTQMYFIVIIGVAEDILFFVMAMDRYVAICNPLHYHDIMSRRSCTLITIGIWTAAVFNSLLYVLSALYMSSCHSNIIHQFYCDPKSLTQTTCTTTQMFNVVNAAEILVFAIIPLMFTVISYVKIFSAIIRMKSKASRKKAFSTCSSHITVISIYNGASAIQYFIPDYFQILNIVFNILYTNIVPMINPIIYSLQNSNIQSAFLEILLIFKSDSRKCVLLRN